MINSKEIKLKTLRIKGGTDKKIEIFINPLEKMLTFRGLYKCKLFKNQWEIVAELKHDISEDNINFEKIIKKLISNINGAVEFILLSETFLVNVDEVQISDD